MATYPVTRLWTVPASGSATVREIIADTTRALWVTYITIRADETNAAKITWEDPNGQPGGFLMAGDAGVIGDDLGNPVLLDYTLRGTQGDQLFMTIGTSATY